jgi:hypothetical protein
MVTGNKIPGNWPAAMEMTDKIAEIIRKLRADAPSLSPVDLDRAKTAALEEIAELTGMDKPMLFGKDADGKG